MSYFDYLCENIVCHDSEKIIGICNLMCPEDEMQLRIKESLVHVLEVQGSEHRLVKSYSRSAADSNMAVPKHLRPYRVLCQTVKYLLFDVTKRSEVSCTVLYDFLNDRLRAVRQDMTIQRFSAQQCACLLEPMIRFYIYFGYKLHGLPLKDFDPVLNKKNMLECMKWFLCCCDELNQSSDIDLLQNRLINLDMREGMTYDRVLMEAAYILCNLDDVHPIYRYLSLPKVLKKHPTLNLCFRIALENLKGNFIQVGRSFERLCPLLYCALCLHLPSMQRQVMQVLTSAYNSRRLSVPSSVARGWLCVASDWEARAVAQHYGLAVLGTAIVFDKSAFKHDAPMHQPKIQMLYNNLNLEMENVFTYNVK